MWAIVVVGLLAIVAVVMVRRDQAADQEAIWAILAMLVEEEERRGLVG